jgi:hypothetical protein
VLCGRGKGADTGVAVRAVAALFVDPPVRTAEVDVRAVQASAAPMSTEILLRIDLSIAPKSVEEPAHTKLSQNARWSNCENSFLRLSVVLTLHRFPVQIR